MNKVFKKYLPVTVFGFCFFCFYGEAGAVPVTFSAETYLANAYTRVVDTTILGGTIIDEDADNPPASSSPPLSAHAEIPGITNQVQYHGMGDAVSQSGHLEMSASSENANPDYNVFSFAHAGFVGDFTATTAETYFAYNMSYDLYVSGDDPFSGFSHSWSLYDISVPGWSLIDGGSGVFSITSGSLSDTTSDEIMLSTTVGHQYRFFFDSGPFLDARINGLGVSTASLIADYGLDTESASVPEPSSLLLLGSGLAGLAYVRRRAKR